VGHTLADSYVSATARSGGAAAEQAAGRKSEDISTDQGESAFLFQRLSVLIQRFNAVTVRGTFALTPTEDHL